MHKLLYLPYIVNEEYNYRLINAENYPASLKNTQ